MDETTSGIETTNDPITTRTAMPTSTRVAPAPHNQRNLLRSFVINGYQRDYASNLSFRSGVLYSYSTPIARHIITHDQVPTTLITSRHYSVTTATHVAGLRRALILYARHRRVFTVDDVRDDHRSAHIRNVLHMLTEAQFYASKAKSGWKSNRMGKAVRCATLVETATRYDQVAKANVLPDMPLGVLADWLQEDGRHTIGLALSSIDDIADAIRMALADKPTHSSNPCNRQNPTPSTP